MTKDGWHRGLQHAEDEPYVVAGVRRSVAASLEAFVGNVLALESRQRD